MQDEGDVTRSRALTLFPAIALGAGLLGGMLGIGGGMIINPLLIEIGMHPQVYFQVFCFVLKSDGCTSSVLLLSLASKIFLLKVSYKVSFTSKDGS